MKIFLIDRPNYKTTRHLIEYLKGRDHEVIVDMYFNPVYAEWADAIWVEWCEGWAEEASRLEGDFEGVYDHHDVCGANKKDHQHSGHFDWSKKPIFIRGIDMDIYYGMFRQVKWENITAFIYIAPHIPDIMSDLHTPGWKDVPKHYINLSVDLEELQPIEERPDGRNIAWVNHNWTGKGLPIALHALRSLIEATDDVSWKLHVVQNGKSNEFWLHRYILHQIKSLGLQDNVVLSGPVPDVNEFLDGMDYLWSTSYKEAFSLIIAEGLAKGLKVLTMDWESSREIWGNDIVCSTIGDLVEKTVDYPLTVEERFALVSQYTVEKEMAKIHEVTGL